jgi:hypothetical protein
MRQDKQLRSTVSTQNANASMDHLQFGNFLLISLTFSQLLQLLTQKFSAFMLDSLHLYKIYQTLTLRFNELKKYLMKARLLT